VKKILMSLFIIAVVGVLITGSVTAWFSDPEVSTGNTFTAGTVDISLDPAGGQDVRTLQGDLELKPCQVGYTCTFIHNDGTNPCEVWKHIANVENREHGIADAEAKFYADNPGSENWLMSNWIYYDLLAFRLLGYSAEATSVTYDDYGKINGIDVDMTVENGGHWVTWTFNFPIDADPGNGNMGYALVIDLDKDGHPDFQVHNNDGTCSAFPWGTHLYSPWDPAMGGYNGWHTGDEDWNTLVTDMDWIQASGERYHNDNTAGIFTVSIAKSRLVPQFSWAAHFGAGGFFDYGGLSKYPEAWTPWSGDSSDFELADIAELLQEVPFSDSFTLTGDNGVECKWVYIGEMEPSERIIVIQSYHLDRTVDNWAQSDRVLFDMEFMAQQTEGDTLPPAPGTVLDGYGRP
jgi:predicted ribosomally synthesized peptide with SipW-like signal peptide